MSITKPTLTKPWASDAPANMDSPGGANDTGIPEAACSIPRRWLNWILNKTDAATRYLMARGIPDWDASEVYSENDRVQWNGGCYRCKENGATGLAKDPSNVYVWESWAYTPAQWQTVFTAALNDAFPSLFSSAFSAQFPISMNGLTLGPDNGTVTSTVGTVSDVQGLSVGRYNNSYGLRQISLTVTDCGTPNGHFDVMLSGNARMAGPKAWVVCTRDVVMNISPRVFVQAIGADIGGVTTDVIRIDWQSSSFANGPHPTVNVLIVGQPN